MHPPCSPWGCRTRRRGGGKTFHGRGSPSRRHTRPGPRSPPGPARRRLPHAHTHQCGKAQREREHANGHAALSSQPWRHRTEMGASGLPQARAAMVPPAGRGRGEAITHTPTDGGRGRRGEAPSIGMASSVMPLRPEDFGVFHHNFRKCAPPSWLPPSPPPPSRSTTGCAPLLSSSHLPPLSLTAACGRGAAPLPSGAQHWGRFVGVLSFPLALSPPAAGWPDPRHGVQHME